MAEEKKSIARICKLIFTEDAQHSTTLCPEWFKGKEISSTAAGGESFSHKGHEYHVVRKVYCITVSVVIAFMINFLSPIYYLFYFCYKSNHCL